MQRVMYCLRIHLGQRGVHRSCRSWSLKLQCPCVINLLERLHKVWDRSENSKNTLYSSHAVLNNDIHSYSPGHLKAFASWCPKMPLDN